jgi:serine/threonine-protein kinase
MRGAHHLADTTIAGKYRLTRELGAGSMGVVYEAEHLELGKRVAVKLMHEDAADSPDVVRRFRREAKAAAAVDSDFIVKVFDAGRDPRLGLYLVNEFLVGEDLETRLKRDRYVDPLPAVTIAWQMARGLANAHAAGVIHRDLKPANVFITRDEEGIELAKIVDFGVSKLKNTLPEAKDASCITAAGVAVGTPRYMSPEQIEAVADLDARTDVWALSAVLYEMLAGRPAFDGHVSVIDIMLRILRAPADPLLDVAPWVPPALADLVHAGLERDRANRIPDAITFAKHLRDAIPMSTAHATIPCPCPFPLEPLVPPVDESQEVELFERLPSDNRIFAAAPVGRSRSSKP